MSALSSTNELTITISEDCLKEGGSDRLDKLLSQNAPPKWALSRSRLQELIQSGHVFQEGIAVLNTKHKAHAGEVYTVKIPQAKPSDLIAQDIPIDVVYEDDALIVINKAAGMVVHPAASQPQDTLVNALLHHAGDTLSGIGGVERPGIVHRIDKFTSGLLVIAKTDAAHEGLGQQFRAHSIERIYDAFVYGAVSANEPRILGLEGVTQTTSNQLKIDLPIGRHKTDRLRQAVRSDGRHAITYINIIGHDEEMQITKLACQLETGRTHQIRVHLSHIGHALLGDPTYGKGARQLSKRTSQTLRDDILALPGQALHARVLGFEHPITNERLRFESALPPEIQKLDDQISKP